MPPETRPQHGPVEGLELERTQVVAIGQRLRAVRESRGISIRELARRVAVSASLISQIETGKAQPSVGTLYSLTRALRISVDRLFSATGTAPAAATGEGPATVPADPEQPPSLVVRERERKVINLDSGVRW